MMSPAYMKEIDEYKKVLASVGITPQPTSFIDETDLYALYLIPSELRKHYGTVNHVIRFMEDGAINGLWSHLHADQYVNEEHPLYNEGITKFFYFVEYDCLGLEELI